MRARTLHAAVVLAAAACSGQTVPIGASGQVTGSGDELDRAVTAVGRADDVYADPRFWAMVDKRGWLAHPESTVMLDGADVRAALGHIRPSNQRYSIEHVGASWVPFYAGAKASTSHCTLDAARPGLCGTILINVGNMADDLYLVNTVAHETTHVIGEAGGACGCEGAPRDARYRDDTDDDAAKVWLVSYALGDLAECFYLMCGDETAVDQCMHHMVNGRYCDRRQLECHARSPIEQNVLQQLRASRGCAGVVDTKQAACGGGAWSMPGGGPTCPLPP